MIYDADHGLAAIMFPVEERRVFADTGSRFAGAPAYKAIVNADSGHVVSIVGRQYQVLPNQDALDLARYACTLAFTDTEAEDWTPKSIEAPRNGGSCTVDLHHQNGGDVLPDWKLAPGVVQRFNPFLRVRNGYNGRTAFSLFFGFEREVCENGMIYQEGIAGIKVSHDTRDIAQEIERKLGNASFRNVPERFRGRLEALYGVTVPRRFFWPLSQHVLRLRRPQRASHDHWPAWAELRKSFARLSDQYVEDLGDTAFALMNVISEFTTRPPEGNPFVRRGRHSYQALAAAWLRDFAIRAADRGHFDVTKYLEQLLSEDRQPSNDRAHHRLVSA